MAITNEQLETVSAAIRADISTMFGKSWFPPMDAAFAEILMKHLKTLQDTTASELKEMMRDPRYWRDENPEFVAKVREGFRRLYDNS